MNSTGARSFFSNRLVRYGTVIALLVALQGIAGCRSQLIQNKEDSLAAAGFILRPANTPERVAMLKRLPPNHFVRREHGDAVHYVYADPIVCSCLYVGTQQAYSQYLRDRQQQQIADQQQLAAQEYRMRPGTGAPGARGARSMEVRVWWRFRLVEPTSALNSDRMLQHGRRELPAIDQLTQCRRCQFLPLDAEAISVRRITCASMGLQRRTESTTEITSRVMEERGAMDSEVDTNAPLMLTSSSRPRAASPPE